MKRFLSMALVVCMLFCMMPVMTHAASSGTCGDNLTWTLDDEGTLTISGTGAMEDYDYYYDTPWASCRFSVNNVVIDSGVTSVGNHAFSDFDKLTSVIIPEGVTSIGDGVFDSTYLLSSLDIPSTVTHIGKRITGYSSNFKQYNVDEDNETYCSVNGILYSKDKKTLIAYPSGVTINDSSFLRGVTTIAQDAFYCVNIDELVIPATVTSMDECFNADNIKNLTFSEGITKIGEQSWTCNGNMIRGSKLVLPHSLTSVGKLTTKCFYNIYYCGTEEEWKQIDGYENLLAQYEQDEYVTVYYNHTMEVSGYTADISTTTPNPRVGEKVTVNVGVNHSSDEYFNAGEMTFNYDSEKLNFNKEDSILGTATVTTKNGTITLADYGANKTFGSGTYSLAFDAIAEGDAIVTMTEAAFINKEGAVSSDLIPATINPAAVNLTIGKKQHAVEIPEGDDVSGNTTVEDDGSYTLTITPNPGYYYTVSATMDGTDLGTLTAVEVDGKLTYTIENVSGALQFNITRTPKTFNVTFTGTAANDFTAATATYNTDYVLTLPTDTGYSYEVAGVMIGGVASNAYTIADGKCTIMGSAIIGDIVITMNYKTSNVTIEGSAGDVTGNDSAEIGKDYTLTITPEAGYDYTVTATMGGEVVQVIDNGDNTYTVKNVTGELVFSIEKTVNTDGVTLNQYVALDGKVMWLVRNEITVTEGKVPTSDGDKMFWSDKYNAYCCLIVSNEYLTLEEVKNSIDIAEGEVSEVNYSMDINYTGIVDASDAQLTYNIYNAMYAGLTEDMTMKKYLRSDVNGDGKVTVEDATAIINHIITTRTSV